MLDSPPTVPQPCLKTAVGMYILTPYPGGRQRILQWLHHVETLHHPHLGKKMSSADEKYKRVDGKLC